MNIDRSKFDTLSIEQQIVRSVRIQSTGDPSYPYEAVCCMCEKEFNSIFGCHEACWGIERDFAFCDYLLGEVPESEINRICEMRAPFLLTFVGYTIGKNLWNIYDSYAEADDAQYQHEVDDANAEYHYLQNFG